MGYIYTITNTTNGKQYVGQAIDVHSRWAGHRSAFREGTTHLYHSMRKYGIEAFRFEIIEECDDSMLSEREQYHIKKLGTFTNGYNHTTGGEGHRLSEETIRKRQDTRARNDKLRPPLKDRMTEEAYDRMIAGLKSAHRPEVWQKATQSHRDNNDGEYFSPSTKKQLSEQKKGTKNPAWKGYFVTPHGCFTSIKLASSLLKCSADVLHKRKKGLPELFYFSQRIPEGYELDVVGSPLLKLSRGNKKVSMEDYRKGYSEDRVTGASGNSSSVKSESNSATGVTA